LTDFGGFLDIFCDFIIYFGIVFAFGMGNPTQLFFIKPNDTRSIFTSFIVVFSLFRVVRWQCFRDTSPDEFPSYFIKIFLIISL